VYNNAQIAGTLIGNENGLNIHRIRLRAKFIRTLRTKSGTQAAIFAGNVRPEKDDAHRSTLLVSSRFYERGNFVIDVIACTVQLAHYAAARTQWWEILAVNYCIIVCLDCTRSPALRLILVRGSSHRAYRLSVAKVSVNAPN